MNIQLALEGQVLSQQSNGVMGGIVVRAYLARANRLLGSAVTNRLGVFSMSLKAEGQPLFGRNSALAFSLALPKGKTPFYRTEPYRLHRWPEELIICVPESALAAAFPKSRLRLLADGLSAKEMEVGQTLSLTGSNFRPSAAHKIILRLGEEVLGQVTLTTDQFGVFAPTVLVPQFGLSAVDGPTTFRVKDAIARFGGRVLSVSVLFGEKTAAQSRISIKRQLSRPLAFVSDAEGRLRNWIQHDKDELHVTLLNIPKASGIRTFIVEGQGEWHARDPIIPMRDRQGRPLVGEIPSARSQTVALAQSGQLLPGAYAIIVRAVRYGFEADEELLVSPRDIIIGRHVTGLVVREDFWRAKPVLGGCVNAVNISGSLVSQRPYFRYRDTFAVGENVWAALDPGIVMPGQIGKKVAFYVIQSKTPAQWATDTTLTHVPSGQPIEVLLQSGCINANEALVWPGASTIGSYDIVADFGNNAPNPLNFVKDGSYDTPLDMIDGYFTPGFRVVQDPGTMAEFTHVGAFNVDGTLLSSLGLAADMTVTDEPGPYFTPGGFSPVSVTFPRLAIVRFPADAAGATSAAQLSTARPNYPVVVVVHGNGHNYTSYAPLLEHLARNGFIAASIHLFPCSCGLGRANAFFDHLNILRTIFGTKLQNNVGVLGHSRGGEAVFKIARLNQSMGLGIGLHALVSLAPTDQYGRETITGATAVPLFVLYGAKDGDVSGWPPYAGYNVRQSGFSLYDRYDNQRKSMAFVYEATHNGFVTNNEVLVSLTEPDQQKILLAYANAFFRMNLRNEPTWVGMFTGEWKPPAVGATPAQIYFQFRDTQRRVLDNFEGSHTATSWQNSTIGDVVSQAGLPANPTETQLYPQDTQSPHDTGGLRLSWDTAGDELTFAVPAGQRNVTGFTTIGVRIGQVVNSAQNPPGIQNLRVALRDGGGNERWIRAAAFQAIPQPAEANIVGNKKSAMTTLRIPLTAYTIVCAGAVQVDLTNVTTVKLQFSEISTGEIAVDEVEFTD
jgi:hypothetical protein